jgi:hypothetical protein
MLSMTPNRIVGVTHVNPTIAHPKHVNIKDHGFSVKNFVPKALRLGVLE